MDVDEGSNLKTMYKGKVYYFCSDGCKRAFQSNPEEYITGGPKGMPSSGHEHHEHHHEHHEHHHDCC
ncbi:hypothetical protein IC007_0262 [Sulfuracidifex tepidarius]|uniref:TRASH domain-containing protein n=1 Tax=Sulfuracidifex tepidarius TaxID=1294262 RepID=A0A510DZZ5_9CREN|nr:hypothetical protein IC007_0262 [Sulfuracidifex tepidarius]